MKNKHMTITVNKDNELEVRKSIKSFHKKRAQEDAKLSRDIRKLTKQVDAFLKKHK